MGIFNTAHKYYRDFLNSDGTFKDFDSIFIESLNNNKANFHLRVDKLDKVPDSDRERLSYIKKLYETILKEIKSNEVAKYYFMSDKSVRISCKRYSTEIDTSLNIDTAKSRIIKAAGKINRQFKFIYKDKDYGKWDSLETIIRLKYSDNIDYNSILKECYKEIDDYCKNSADNTVIKKEIVGIKLNTTAKMTEKPSSEEFENFIEMIRPYTKNTVSAIQELINNNENSVAYFNYLVDPTRPKDSSEKELSNDLRRMLGLEELYITSIDKIF